MSEEYLQQSNYELNDAAKYLRWSFLWKYLMVESC